MTQPPDDRPPRPDEPEGEAAPENAPTVAWTPPDAESERAPEAPAEPPAEPPPPPAEPAVPTPPEPAAPGGPIISATPTPPASGWQTPGQPGTPGVPPVAPPGGGWEVPTAAAAAVAQQDGYAIAGIGARVVAWLIDVTISGLVPALLAFVLINWSDIIRQAFEQAQLDPTGRIPTEAYTIPVTLDYILVTLIGLGIQFLYFVGFWTSRWRATPGMIGLKMRVVDERTGDTLSVTQATKRWIALGWPLALLSLIPTLQAVQGLIQFGLWIFLFFTTVTNDRRQGLHDKWANSLVIRSVTSGNGATFVGCLVWGVLVILLTFVIITVFLAAAMPTIQEYINQNPQLS
jgi:uncharacterized RDD family membrane protein YckC